LWVVTDSGSLCVFGLLDLVDDTLRGFGLYSPVWLACLTGAALLVAGSRSVAGFLYSDGSLFAMDCFAGWLAKPSGVLMSHGSLPVMVS
jgi:hypothetical protein